MTTFAPAAKRLDDVAGILDAAVRDDRDAVLRRDAGRVVDRRDLRHADACNDTGGADGARADADLHAVRARVDQGLRAALPSRCCPRSAARSGYAFLTLRTASRMPLLWPCAESSASTSTWALTSSATRSSTSAVAPMAAPHSRRPVLIPGGIRDTARPSQCP